MKVVDESATPSDAPIRSLTVSFFSPSKNYLCFGPLSALSRIARSPPNLASRCITSRGFKDDLACMSRSFEMRMGGLHVGEVEYGIDDGPRTLVQNKR